MKAEEEYELIPLSEITDEARKIAVAWMECENRDWIGQKHKLASDIMNYAKKQCQKRDIIIREQSFYIEYLIKVIKSESILESITIGVRDQYEKNIEQLKKEL